jgi:hypothetical protein
MTSMDGNHFAITNVDYIAFSTGGVLSNANRNLYLAVYQTNAVIITNYVNVTNNLDVADVGGLVQSVKLGMDRLLWQKNDTNTQWVWWDFSTRSLNPDCWAAPIDFSGISVEEESGQTLTMVTRRHAMTCAHSPPWTGSAAVWAARDGVLVTNWVASVFSGSNDVCVVTLSNDMPDSVCSFPILPADFTNYLRLDFIVGTRWFSSNTLNLETICYRPNTGKMNQKTVHNVTGPYLGVTPPSWTHSSIFSEDFVTGGDSGGPVFMAIDGYACLLYCTFFPGNGPWVSLPDNLNQITNAIGTNLTVVNLQRFPKL